MPLEPGFRNKIQVVKANVRRRQVSTGGREIRFKCALAIPGYRTQLQEYRKTDKAALTRFHVHKRLRILGHNKKRNIAQLDASQGEALSPRNPEQHPVSVDVRSGGFDFKDFHSEQQSIRFAESR